MKYKAIILDVDGTCVPNSLKGMPSENVVSAITNVQKIIYVSVCTSRPIFIAKNVIRALGIKNPCGVNDATQIYDPNVDKVIRSYPLTKQAIRQVCEFYSQKHIRVMVNEGEVEEYYDGGTPPENICSLCVPEVPYKQALTLKEELMSIPDIAVQTPPSYQKGNVWVSVTSALATKLHSVVEITKLLGVQPSETIGIGDGYNDFPLLEACGLKIAMGNAVPELKAIADFIAPSVEDDGVATVIKKFILN
jgi:hydroxymethylpyrimidine pyrophosphatase-like HAD family hydrolase